MFSLRLSLSYSRIKRKIIYAENEKPENEQPRMNKPYPPFNIPSLTLCTSIRMIIGGYEFEANEELISLTLRKSFIGCY